MRQLEMACRTLAELAERIRAREVGEGPEHDRGFTALIDVVDETGRSLSAPDVQALRDFLPFVAAGRETLESCYPPEDVHKTPMAALSNDKSAPAYAAGALWATSAIVEAFLAGREQQRQAHAGRSMRGEVRRAVMELVVKHDVVRPQDALDHVRQSYGDVDRSTVSRALGDLLEAGVIELAESPPGGDRRSRYYRATEQPATPPHALVRNAREALMQLYAVCERDEADHAVDSVVADVRVGASGR